MTRATKLAAFTFAILLIATTIHAQNQDDKTLQRFRDIYKELVETNTTLSAGDCTLAAKRMAARLKTAGYPEPICAYSFPMAIQKKAASSPVLHGSDPRPRQF